jgi:hypothetical protein
MIMATTLTSTSPQHNWRRFAVGVMIGLGSFLAVMSMTAAWTRNTLLDTNKFVAIVGPLPQQPAVATALGTYGVDQLYASVDISQKIKDALPPQASFLAGPLSSQLKTLATSTAIKAMESDQFSNVWEAIIRTTHSNFVTLITNPKRESRVNLPLDKITSAVQTALAKANIEGFDGSRLADAQQTILSAQDKVANLREAVIILNRLVIALPLVAVALLMGALAVSRRRVRTLVATFVTLAVASALALVGLRVGQSQLLDQVANPQNLQAVQVIWNAVVARLHEAFVIGVWVSLGAAAITTFFAPYDWAVRLRKRLGLVPSPGGKLNHYTAVVRQFTRQYYRFFNLGGLAIVLVSLLVWPQLVLATVIGAAAVLGIYISIVTMIAAPANTPA